MKYNVYGNTMDIFLRLIDDPILRQKTSSVDKSDLSLILDLKSKIVDIMLKSGGVAIAANQVGIAKSFFIMTTESGEAKLFINPLIVDFSNERSFDEGCLSIPGVSSKTKRYNTVRLKYLDENFIEKEIDLKGILAIAAQHEIDHLNGKLYMDTVTNAQKNLILKKHRDYMKTRNKRSFNG